VEGVMVLGARVGMASALAALVGAMGELHPKEMCGREKINRLEANKNLHLLKLSKRARRLRKKTRKVGMRSGTNSARRKIKVVTP